VIRLRLLGGVELVGSDGTDIDPILQQPKRLAVLAVLATRAGTDWHRRDSLLAMFWPEHDAESARGALRRTLTFLRRHLGDAAIQTRGDEVAVAGDAVWCDVAACAEALREKRWAEALDLHRGELLTGVHVPSAPDFERWVDATRERLVRETAQAAATLAAEAERSGGLAEAAAWRRRALELQPHDEAGLRALLSLLDRLGDRAGAVRAFDTFVARLSADLDLAPDPRTTALVAAIRARTPEVGIPITAPQPSPNVIAVFPFEIRGPGELQYLREGMVDLLSAKLDGAGDLRTVDPGTVLTSAAAVNGPPEPGTIRPVAARLGAGSFLLGSVVADAGHVLVRATLHETGGEGEVRVDAEGGADAAIFGVVDDFVRRLLASRTQSLGGHLTRLGALTTGSLPALRAYLDGERAFRRGYVYESRTAYAGAVERDPGFALAHYRLAAAHLTCGDPVAAVQAVERATAGARHLNVHTRMLLAALAALVRGAFAEAERLTLRLLAERPDDVESWYRFARVQLDGNRLRGRPEAEARVALERTGALDPRHAAARADLARLTWATGDRQAARDHARAYLALSPTGDDAAVMAVLARDEPAPDRLAAARPPALGPWPDLLAAHEAAARQAPDAARSALARAARRDPDLALDHEAFLATMTTGGPDRALIDRLAPAATGDMTASTPVADLRGVIRLHDMGLVLAPAAPDEATACAPRVAAAPVPSWAASLPAALASGLDARLAFDRGDATSALAALDAIVLGPWVHLAHEVPQCGLVAERLLRSRALAALGRHDEAAAWRTPPATPRPFEWALLRNEWGTSAPVDTSVPGTDQRRDE